jgi:hypothetical protein
MRRHPPHHLSPARQIARRGKIPKPASAAPSHHSNAPIRPESQSILSKIVARGPRRGGTAAPERREPVDEREFLTVILQFHEAFREVRYAPIEHVDRPIGKLCAQVKL